VNPAIAEHRFNNWRRVGWQAVIICTAVIINLVPSLVHIGS
jgi:hypothetical protein